MHFHRSEWRRAVQIAVALGLLLLPGEKLNSTSSRPSEPVTIVFLFNDWEIPDRIPGSDQPLEEFTRETGIVKRPTIVTGSKYEDVTRAYMSAVHSVLAREQSAPQAAASLEKQLVQITGFKTGPPLARNHQAGKSNP